MSRGTMKKCAVSCLYAALLLLFGFWDGCHHIEIGSPQTADRMQNRRSFQFQPCRYNASLIKKCPGRGVRLLSRGVVRRGKGLWKESLPDGAVLIMKTLLVLSGWCLNNGKRLTFSR
ncbi:uncharacterized protein LOC110832452 [Zootermopsis nevadensis]|uniref:uncharacterized protein LOC110832452 n=1 Tax=Zootermopsis nevadensis TaxID=136037 RepID=UPI000B8EABFD|nr:uncharacterized protein LOC110832452 [Zootermopsis nevadensis]